MQFRSLRTQVLHSPKHEEKGRNEKDGGLQGLMPDEEQGYAVSCGVPAKIPCCPFVGVMGPVASARDRQFLLITWLTSPHFLLWPLSE